MGNSGNKEPQKKSPPFGGDFINYQITFIVLGLLIL